MERVRAGGATVGRPGRSAGRPDRGAARGAGRHRRRGDGDGMPAGREAGGSVVAVSAIVVPVRDPLDTPFPERERKVAEVQEMARSLAADYGVECQSVVVRTRNAGRTIVDAVNEHGATLIVIGSPEKRRLAAQPAGRVLRRYRRLRPAQGAVPRDRDPLPLRGGGGRGARRHPGAGLMTSEPVPPSRVALVTGASRGIGLAVAAAFAAAGHRVVGCGRSAEPSGQSPGSTTASATSPARMPSGSWWRAPSSVTAGSTCW